MMMRLRKGRLFNLVLKSPLVTFGCTIQYWKKLVFREFKSIWEGSSKRERAYVYLKRLHIVPQQKSTQCCKACILQLKKNGKKLIPKQCKKEIEMELDDAYMIEQFKKAQMQVLFRVSFHQKDGSVGMSLKMIADLLLMPFLAARY